MNSIPHQCRICMHFNDEDSLCKIHEQLPGEYGREEVKDCQSFIQRGSKESDELKLLMQYIEENPSDIEERISSAVDNILNDYEYKYKVLVVGIARRKIKSIIKMVDIVDVILDRIRTPEVMDNMGTSQSIRLLSELNHSMNNDLAFIMKLVNPETKLLELQAWIDARSVNINTGSSIETDTKADDILKVTGASRDKIRDAFDALLHQIGNDKDVIEVVEQEETSDEG